MQSRAANWVTADVKLNLRVKTGQLPTRLYEKIENLGHFLNMVDGATGRCCTA